MTDPLLIETAANVLNKMMLKEWFDICSLRAAAKLLDVTLAGPAYERLEKLHCVHFTDMPQTLRDQVPQLVTEVLANEAFRFEFPPPTSAGGGVIDAAPSRRPFLLRLLGSKTA